MARELRKMGTTEVAATELGGVTTGGRDDARTVPAGTRTGDSTNQAITTRRSSDITR